MMRLYTYDDFVNKAQIIHNNMYDYSLVNYVNSQTKIEIICPKHGIFNQKPNSHINGSGCRLCGIEKQKNRISLKKIEFIKKANVIHNNKYDYNLVEFKNTHDYVTIVCAKHGKFLQQVYVHLNGSGCPKCGEMITGQKKRNNTEYFILKSNKIHNHKYDYSLVNYVTAHHYVDIICPIHGKFNQTANSHLNGNGCPLCKESIGEKNISKYLSKHLIVFERNKKFNDCKNINYLTFDFYLPAYNVLIEFDGEQHFISINHFGGIDKLNNQIFNDKIKDEYARLNNFHLLRIKYNQIREIDKILNEYEPISQR